jgi:hypothetical protein
MQNPLNRPDHVQILCPFQFLGILIGGDHNAADGSSSGDDERQISAFTG